MITLYHILNLLNVCVINTSDVNYRCCKLEKCIDTLNREFLSEGKLTHVKATKQRERQKIAAIFAATKSRCEFDREHYMRNCCE